MSIPSRQATDSPPQSPVPESTGNPAAEPAAAPAAAPHFDEEMLPHVEVGMANASLKGEDKCCWAEATIGGEKVVFVMVADGHGGKEASAWLHEHLIAAFVARAGDDPSGAALRAAGRSVFIEAHAAICAMKNHTAGSTLTVVAINSARAEITTVNVGDSGALMIENSKAVPLSEDHRLEDNERERERVD